MEFTTAALELLSTYTDEQIGAYFQGYALAMWGNVESEASVTMAVALVRVLLARNT